MHTNSVLWYPVGNSYTPPTPACSVCPVPWYVFFLGGGGGTCRERLKQCHKPGWRKPNQPQRGGLLPQGHHEFISSHRWPGNPTLFLTFFLWGNVSRLTNRWTL